MTLISGKFDCTDQFNPAQLYVYEDRSVPSVLRALVDQDLWFVYLREVSADYNYFAQRYVWRAGSAISYRTWCHEKISGPTIGSVQQPLWERGYVMHPAFRPCHPLNTCVIYSIWIKGKTE